MKHPKVSILMPVYNPGRYLGQAIDSLLSQSFDDFELIAIDDGSTDGATAYLSEIAKRDQRVRLLSLEHGGIVKALNRGIEEAKGRYIARMDADDVALPKRLEIQVATMENQPDIVALGGGAIAIDPKDRPIYKILPPEGHLAIMEQLRLGRGSAILHPTLMVRTFAMRSTNGYREAFRHIEDLDLYWRLGQMGRLGNLEACVLLYRQHPNSVNVLKGEMQRDLTQRWLREVVDQGDAHNSVSSFYRPQSTAQLYYDWGVKALNSSYRRTALLSVLHSIRLNPFGVQQWKLLVRIIGQSMALRQKKKDK